MCGGTFLVVVQPPLGVLTDWLFDESGWLVFLLGLPPGILGFVYGQFRFLKKFFIGPFFDTFIVSAKRFRAFGPTGFFFL